jgi:hypothetical protein
MDLQEMFHSLATVFAFIFTSRFSSKLLKSSTVTHRYEIRITAKEKEPTGKLGGHSARYL